jgi:hypothetical protein
MSDAFVSLLDGIDTADLHSASSAKSSRESLDTFTKKTNTPVIFVSYTGSDKYFMEFVPLNGYVDWYIDTY